MTKFCKVITYTVLTSYYLLQVGFHLYWTFSERAHQWSLNFQIQWVYLLHLQTLSFLSLSLFLVIPLTFLVVCLVDYSTVFCICLSGYMRGNSNSVILLPLWLLPNLGYCVLLYGIILCQATYVGLILLHCTFSYLLDLINFCTLTVSWFPPLLLIFILTDLTEISCLVCFKTLHVDQSLFLFIYFQSPYLYQWFFWNKNLIALYFTFQLQAWFSWSTISVWGLHSTFLLTLHFLCSSPSPSHKSLCMHSAHHFAIYVF